ncbi:MAG: hypothetical protein HZB46_11755 [Solirubrobacterales bacterium]|nr:hypothetical protein [Solirubrobacterales bacterium]
MRRSTSVLGLAAAVLVAWPSTALADREVGSAASNGPVAAYGGTVAWSTWDGVAGGFRLVVLRGGSATVLADVAPSAAPFDVSAGPGPTGSTWLVWSRCATFLYDTRSGCDVVRYDLAAPGERAVTGASTPTADEFAPSIWRTRIAYARRTAGTPDRVVIGSLSGARDRVVDGIPTTVCGELSEVGACRPTTTRLVADTAVRGDALAVASRVSTGSDEAGICGLGIVRRLDLRTGAFRDLAPTVCGLSGAQPTSTAFDDSGRLLWARSCPGDPSACEKQQSGPYRYRPVTGETVSLTPSYGSRVQAVAASGKTPVVELASTSRCAVPGGDQPYTSCSSITLMDTGTTAPKKVKPALYPPSGYVADGGPGDLQVVRPPKAIACETADPAPKDRATLWAGQFLPPIPPPHFKERTTPALSVTATSGSRTVKATIEAQTKREPTWHYARLDLGSKGCGRTWTLTYKPKGKATVRFQVKVGAR